MSGRMYPFTADTSSRMRMAYRRAVWNSIDISKILTEEIDREILENLRSLQEAESETEK